ncbi:MAG TPA: DUF116 domain-containing protein [Methanoregulaceae archaeon]|nr:DUF116 domain-containing protein [Methanoregulaceae archaeon]
MEINTALWEQFVFLVGEITLIIILGILFFSILMVVISIYSIKTGRLYFPRFLKAGITMVEGTVKALFRLVGLEDAEMLSFFVQLRNSMNKGAFAEIPVDQRVIFFPQCLRSAKCPAHLSPEGLKCISCGQCTVGYWRVILEKIGYKVFIVPGSSFIKRMVKKYRPRAIIGVGCLSEVKEGLDLTDKFGVVGMGVVTMKEGCVETLVNWDDVMEVALLGIPPELIPEEILKNNESQADLESYPEITD